MIVNSLQDLPRVGEGEDGVGSLGNNCLSYDGKTSYSYADESFHISAVLAVESVQNQSGRTIIELLERSFTHLCFTCCTACGSRVKVFIHVGNHLL